MTKKSRLYSKYLVSKRDGTPIEPGSEYLVLKLNAADPEEREAALVAASNYAQQISRTNQDLARDIAATCNRIRGEKSSGK